jgi:hypothetical protein
VLHGHRPLRQGGGAAALVAGRRHVSSSERASE